MPEISDCEEACRIYILQLRTYRLDEPPPPARVLQPFQDPFPGLDCEEWKRRVRLQNAPNALQTGVPADPAGPWWEENAEPEGGVGWEKRYAQLEPRVCKRERYRCWRCERWLKAKRARSVHHIWPRAEGGPTTLENLVLLCRPCHDYVELADPPLRSLPAIAGSYAGE